MASTGERVAVFGGTGFLGHRIVERLLDAGHAVRVAVRRPERLRVGSSRRDGTGQIEKVAANVRDPASVARAMAGTSAVVNAVSLYVERGGATFRAVHVEGARNVASRAAHAGVRRLVHISGIGAVTDSESRYIRCRGEGEIAVRESFPSATVLRPSVMFGPDDSFLNMLIRLIRLLPVVPLFGDGRTRLQPVYVEDVATAASLAASRDDLASKTYELGGPQVLRYREVLDLLMRHYDLPRRLLPVPFAAWKLQASLLQVLPSPPLTGDQIALMRRDNVASGELPGLRDLDITPTALRDVLPQYR